MRSKVCFIVPEHNSATPTHFKYIYGLLNVLQENFDIFLIIERGSKPDFLSSEGGSASGGKKYYVQRFSFLPFRIAENFLIILYARFRGYRDFYIHYSFLSTFNASLVAKISGGRTFYWNCGLPWKYKRSFIRETFELITYKLITYLVTGTEGIKKEYAVHYSLPLSKIKILPNWIDLNNFSARGGSSYGGKIRSAISEKIRKEIDPNGENKILLFVHHLSKRKGAHHLPDIIYGLKNEKVILAVIGDGPEREALESNVKCQMSNVKFLGNIPNRDIADYFGAADIFIMPSEEEGFPHVMLEAMASGVIPVSFSVGGVREILPEEFSGYAVTLGDKNSFINKVREILNYRKEEIRQLSDIGRNWVKKFDLPVVVEEFKKLFYYK